MPWRTIEEETMEEDKKQIPVVGVRFKEVGKIYYFSPSDLEIQPRDHVIVETARGLEYGEAVVGPKQVDLDEVVQPLKKIIRKATEEDDQQLIENRVDEKNAYVLCQEKIREHKLPMKLIDVEYTFDRSKAIFYFTAEGRVDFRELVKDLASVFRTRIELRQIGVRDEAKMIGGLGSCGRELCCSTFLGDFETVSIKMAKEQNLSLNPTKISGICGRLMCCLKYETEAYKYQKSIMPREGSKVKTPLGVGKVIKANIIQELLIVQSADEKQELFELSEVSRVDGETPLDFFDPELRDRRRDEKMGQTPLFAEHVPKKTRGESPDRATTNRDSSKVTEKKKDETKGGSGEGRKRSRRNRRPGKKSPGGEDMRKTEDKGERTDQKPREKSAEAEAKQGTPKEGAAKKKRRKRGPRKSGRNREKAPESKGRETNEGH